VGNNIEFPEAAEPRLWQESVESFYTVSRGAAGFLPVFHLALATDPATYGTLGESSGPTLLLRPFLLTARPRPKTWLSCVIRDSYPPFFSSFRGKRVDWGCTSSICFFFIALQTVVAPSSVIKTRPGSTGPFSFRCAKSGDFSRFQALGFCSYFSSFLVLPRRNTPRPPSFPIENPPPPRALSEAMFHWVYQCFYVAFWAAAFGSSPERL